MTHSLTNLLIVRVLVRVPLQTEFAVGPADFAGRRSCLDLQDLKRVELLDVPTSSKTRARAHTHKQTSETPEAIHNDDGGQDRDGWFATAYACVRASMCGSK